PFAPGFGRYCIAFDQFERLDATTPRKPTKSGKDLAKSGKDLVEYVRAKDGDSRLFGAVDSAIRAALHWQNADRNLEKTHFTINVPICILSNSFWHVSLDNVTVGQAQSRTKT